MGTWSFEITRQSDWDIWSWLCIFASLVLISYAVAGLLRRSGRTHPGLRSPSTATSVGWVSLGLIAFGVLGTGLVLGLSSLRTAGNGMVWTFVLLAILSAVFYLRLLDRLKLWRMAVLLALRILALLALVPMLFEPVLRYVHIPPPERPIIFLVDTSGSMSTPDVQNGPTRLQNAWQALQPELEAIREHFVPTFYTFDAGARRLERAEVLAAARADGKSTDILTALRHSLANVQRDDAIVVLMSDGIDNSTSNIADAVGYLRQSVHTVLIGSETAAAQAIVNVGIADVQADDDFAVGHESKVTVMVRSTALADRVVEVKLSEVDAAGKPIGITTTAPLVLQSKAEAQKVILNYTPTQVGVHRVAVWIDPIAGERTLADNRQEFQALAVDPGIKVLYIEGRARPEFQQLRRLLEGDPNVEAATLLRITENRFVAGGTVDRKPMAPRLPTTPQEWQNFDVIILGDLDGSFLSPPNQVAIEQAVAGGKSLLMLGGSRSFGPGGYAGTPIEKALPVFVGGVQSPQDEDKFVPQMTADGATHPALEGLLPFFGTDRKAPEKQLPPLNGNVVVDREKSGAQVLLIHSGRNGPDGKPEIVLAVQRYGKGRSAALTLHSVYLWNLPLYGLGQDSPYNRLWGQIVRWLAGADVRGREKGSGLDLLLGRTILPPEEGVRIRAMVRDEHGDATRYAQTSLTIRKSDATDVKPFAMNPVDGRSGSYEVLIPPQPAGDYIVAAVATKDGKELGRQEAKFSVIPPADELFKIAANAKLMQTIAAETHATFHQIGQFPELIQGLIRDDPTSKPEQVAIRFGNFFGVAAGLFGKHEPWPGVYDLPMQAMLVVPLLTAEWIMRRRWQLT